MLLIIIKGCNSSENTFKQIESALNLFWSEEGKPLIKSYALMIDGDSLKFALEIPCKDFFLELSCRCKAVICCRVSPLQKAQVVLLVNKSLVKTINYRVCKVPCDRRWGK